MKNSKNLMSKSLLIKMTELFSRYLAEAILPVDIYAKGMYAPAYVDCQ